MERGTGARLWLVGESEKGLRVSAEEKMRLSANPMVVHAIRERIIVTRISWIRGAARRDPVFHTGESAKGLAIRVIASVPHKEVPR